MNRMHINVSKPYDVIIGRKLINNLVPIIEEVCDSKRIAIVTDDIVNELYGQIVVEQFKKKEFDVCKYVFPNGEKSKNINTLSDILEYLANFEFKRNDSIIALGGGVVGDITGLSAALYARGIKFIQIPTTLLAMVDASIGGKTAIDLKAGKNLAGVFWQPSLVVCDIDIIENLPLNIFTEGMGEVIKYDVIANLGICDKVNNNTINNDLESVITDCIEVKKKIVEEDEFELKGIRKLLNAGHTMAHAIEKMSDYKIAHGYAVGTGLLWETGIAYQMNICDYKTFRLIKQAIARTNLLVDFSYDYYDLVDCMKRDKKNDDNRISFVLPSRSGECKEHKIDAFELVELIKQVGEFI